jgi:putative transposase
MHQTVPSPKRYPSSLKDQEWELLAPLIPPPAEGYTRTVCMRGVLDGIFYKLRTGCSWRQLPHDLPKWGVVYEYFVKFQKNGVWEMINDVLKSRVRIKHGKDPQPTTAIVDSQTVKTTEKRGSMVMTAEKR